MPLFKVPSASQRGLFRASAGAIPVFRADLVDSIDASTGQTATFTRASSATYIDKDDGLIKTAAANVARFESDGYLAEAAATNLCTHSQEFDDSVWVGSTVTANDATAPDGTTTADKIAASSSGILQSATVSSGAKYTGGLWLKAAAPVTVPVVIDGTSTNAAVTTEWQRFSSTVASSSGTSIDFGLGIGTYTVWAWQGQVEAGPILTSDIATTTTAVTRKADVLKYAFVGPAQGTIAATMNAPAAAWSGYKGVVALASDSDNTTRLYASYNTRAGEAALGIKSGGAVQANVNSGITILDGSSHDLRAIFSPTLNQLYRDSVHVGVDDTSATIPVTDTLYVGTWENSIYQLNGHIKNVKVYDRLVYS